MIIAPDDQKHFERSGGWLPKPQTENPNRNSGNNNGSPAIWG